MDIFCNTVKCQNIHWKLNIISDRKFLYRLEAPREQDSVVIVVVLNLHSFTVFLYQQLFFK